MENLQPRTISNAHQQGQRVCWFELRMVRGETRGARAGLRRATSTGFHTLAQARFTRRIGRPVRWLFEVTVTLRQTRTRRVLRAEVTLLVGALACGVLGAGGTARRSVTGAGDVPSHGWTVMDCGGCSPH